ncbi:MAG TPA: putative sugar nucleotidyl transferase [Gemmataceae bacterium]|nr:putative sugar nucleotidyl transferase [Gemmataceae bacterium]
MRLCLFEDQGVGNLEPLSFTRAVFDLLCGLSSLGRKQCQYFAAAEVGVLVRPALASLYSVQHPGTPVNDLAWLRAAATILVNGRWLPPAETPVDMSNPCVATIGDEIAYVLVDSERLATCSSDNLEECLDHWAKSLPRRPAGGRLMRYPWELVHQNPEQICCDYGFLDPGLSVAPASKELALVGPADRLLIDPSARLDPMILADTTRGPVVIDRDAVVTAFSRLEGPCHIGPGTHILAAKIRAGTTLGPGCRIGGEVECSIIQGHTNKYHEGFVGHSYVGEWVNIGAGTQTSDLRNDYGEVSVPTRGQPVATGLSKVGCFIGDHSKTGLGTLLNTGTSIGVFCNCLPSGGYLPKYLPSFSSWWNGSITEHANLVQLLRTAEDMMQRRGQLLTELHRELFHQLQAQTAAERSWAIRTQDSIPLRQSA